ncbi:G-protein coupled receptor Mth2-like isoform X2 [Pogonomyrmex barbatus]|uniref:G-protein coupled receptor Mth2-like isoform X2 n=1 Tax=Pogonomyrmex barbatus TaxID=144034 RepID=A0A6I9WW35_9HYME|nr:G-protein coupled receptor Mth2-like isoform X2 [Pogonomyrmex barbatus]
MCGRSDLSFNSALFLAACGLLTASGAVNIPSREDPRCSPSFSVILPLENGTGGTDTVPQSLENNSSFFHDGIEYSAEERWSDGNVTYGCICRLRRCIRKCCRDDQVLRKYPEKKAICQEMPENDTKSVTAMPDLRLPIYQMTEEIQHIETLREHFLLVQNNACPGHTYVLNADDYDEDKVILQTNGSLVNTFGKLFPFWNYCIDWQVTFDQIGILACLTPDVQTDVEVLSKERDKEHMVHHVGIMISIPFLVTTFLVYAITPELRNLYGKTLMCYVMCLIIAYVFLILVNYIYMSPIRALCYTTAFIIHFSFLASFFWLNVMCFDIWWTFGGFRSLQGSVKQREKRKFVMYSIYAWGTASVFTIICAIMDFVPSVPKELIRPQFGELGCWFTTDEAKALYFYGPMTVTVICNICLFVSTALKIVRHRKDTAHHLRSSESRRHDDNKQWFNLYLKLFIVMGINWSMEIISWLFKNEPRYLWYLTDLTNTLQGLIIFIIFVWKEKIKRLLLKRFGCQENGLFSRNSTHSGCHSTASRTCTTTTSQGVMPLQEKISPYVQTNCRAKSSSDEADP